MVSRAEHKRIAGDLYKKLEIAVTALENATSEKKEEKAEARIKVLEEAIATIGTPKPKAKAKEKYECEECGGDLYEVEKGVFYCEECGLYFEQVEEEEEED